MHREITARVVAEEELKKAHEELKASYGMLESKVQERTAELTLVNRDLARANEELEDFTTRVSHDLRNSLFVVRLIIEESIRKPKILKEDMNELARGFDHLMTFVERMLQLARAGKVIDKKVPIDLAALAIEVFTRQKGADETIELLFEGDISHVHCDPLGMEHVFANLISNALHHRDPAKKVLKMELSARETEGEIELRCRDNGIGIEVENLGRIFDLAFTTRKTGRFGFGLPIVRKIIEAHGGSVKARSEGPGRGAEFIISMPVE